MNLLLLDEDELGVDRTMVLHGRRADHLVRVLAVKIGSELRAGIVRGSRGMATVESVSGGRVAIAFEPREAPPTPPALELVLALPRPKVLSRCIQHAASFGLDRICLVNAWRVNKAYFQSPRIAADALAIDARLGCEQGGHTWTPTIEVFHRFMDYCNESKARPGVAARLVAHPGASATVATAKIEPGSFVTLAIGPEGGWIPREMETLERGGFEGVKLSSAILRTEAAVVAALAQLDLVRTPTA